MAHGAMTAEQVRSALMGENARLLSAGALSTAAFPSALQACAAPFAGIGGLVLRHVGFARSPGNPALCTKCLGKLRKQGMSGVEMPVTLLFSDVRGSTAMGERTPEPVPRLSRSVLPAGLGSDRPWRRARRQGHRRRGRRALLRRDQWAEPCGSRRRSRRQTSPSEPEPPTLQTNEYRRKPRPHGEARSRETTTTSTIEDFFHALGDVLNTDGATAATGVQAVIVSVATTKSRGSRQA